MYLNWVEIDKSSLMHNITLFKSLAGAGRKLMAIVKANAYGHGMSDVARIVIEAGADWLGVYSLDEGILLRKVGFSCPILIMGYIPIARLAHAVENNLSIGIATLDTLEHLGILSKEAGPLPKIHLKLETGLNRLGISLREVPQAQRLLARYGGIKLEGLYTHYANIEDTLQHDFAGKQLSAFQRMCRKFSDNGYSGVHRHTACTAAALLFPKTYLEMLRVGIGIYGMWPSKETLITALETREHVLDLKPVLTWKSRIAQLKMVRPGDTIGYGRSYRVTRPARIAVIPTGYADGYDRKLSNRGHVLIHGKEAPVVGRICMNMFMVDVTHIKKAAIEDEVVLLGRQHNAVITAEHIAELIGTINYEVTTRISSALPRVVR